MSSLTATEAKNRFGELLEMARKEPVEVQKNGRTVAAVISPDDYEILKRIKQEAATRPAFEKLLARSIERRRSLYEALAK
jgi:prevent-host-death family protein